MAGLCFIDGKRHPGTRGGCRYLPEIPDKLGICTFTGQVQVAGTCGYPPFLTAISMRCWSKMAQITMNVLIEQFKGLLLVLPQ
jgi:hypothetical protein